MPTPQSSPDRGLFLVAEAADEGEANREAIDFAEGQVNHRGGGGGRGTGLRGGG
ncbi:MAG: hypothetical protein OXS30_07615 [Chloroflexota bacterium]|nr:hypothetical protein [Chloroflexota bacterium]